MANTILEKPDALRQSRPTVKVIDRTRELQWLEAHRDEYAGQWVALDGDRLISHGPQAREVFAAARQAGVERPLVVLVESRDALPFGGW